MTRYAHLIKKQTDDAASALQATTPSNIASAATNISDVKFEPVEIKSPLTLRRLANATGILYGSVGVDDIHQAVISSHPVDGSESLPTLAVEQITIKDFEPFKEIGTYVLNINGKDVVVEIVKQDN